MTICVMIISLIISDGADSSVNSYVKELLDGAVKVGVRTLKVVEEC